MPQLSWDQVGKRFYEAGVDRGVLYVAGSPGVAWNGLVSVEENRSGEKPTPYYLDGVLQFHAPSVSDFSATMKAFTFPDEFLPFDGIADATHGMYLDNQTPGTFGLSYRTRMGNDLAGLDYGYKLHLLYNLSATPTDKAYETLSSETAPVEFEWDIVGAPETVPGFRPTAHAIFDSTKMDGYLLREIEDQLYGTSTTAAAMPPLADIYSMVFNWELFTVVDNGDGTFSVTGPEELISVSGHTFYITGADAEMINPGAYHISTTYREEE